MQECRLIKSNRDSLPWRAADCSRCPVPDILNANADPDMELTVTVETRLMGLGRKLDVEAYCARHRVKIDDPYVGCTIHNQEKAEALDIFRQALEGEDD